MDSDELFVWLERAAAVVGVLAGVVLVLWFVSFALGLAC